MYDVIVLDCGTHSTRVGYSGEGLPRYVTPTVVGATPGATSRYVGLQALRKRAELRITRPVVRGRVRDWDDVTEVWRGALRTELQTDPALHPVLLTEAPGTAPRDRELTAEIWFEELGVPRFSLANQSVLGLYAEGKTSGVVVDVGAGHAACVPVLEGKLIPYALTEINYTGDDVTNQLLASLGHQCGFSTSSSVHRDIVNHLKEKLCYIRTDVKKPATPPLTYTLPDKTALTLTPSQLTTPECLFGRVAEEALGGSEGAVGEALFGSEGAVGEALVTTLEKLEDEAVGNLVAENTVLCGGVTDTAGFRERLSQSLGLDTPLPGRCGKGRYVPWIGGSVLGSLSTFNRLSVLKSEYEECGSGLINRKCRMDDGGDSFYGLYGFSGS